MFSFFPFWLQFLPSKQECGKQASSRSPLFVDILISLTCTHTHTHADRQIVYLPCPTAQMDIQKQPVPFLFWHFSGFSSLVHIYIHSCITVGSLLWSLLISRQWRDQWLMFACSCVRLRVSVSVILVRLQRRLRHTGFPIVQNPFIHQLASFSVGWNTNTSTMCTNITSDHWFVDHVSRFVPSNIQINA